MALNRKNRISLQRDFDALLKDGSRTGDGVFLIRVLKKDHGSVRIASPISARISKKAVERNKLRRRIQEVLRNRIDHITPGVDILVHMRPEAMSLTYSEIEERLVKLLVKSNLLSKARNVKRET